MSDKDKKVKAAKSKDAKGKVKKKEKRAAASKAAGLTLSIAGHPRAGSQVRRAKAIGGLVGFAIAAYLSLKAKIPPDQIGERAIIAGAVGYLLAWGCSVTVWRHLVIAELRVAAELASADRPAGPAGDEGPGAGGPGR
jgi:hypothetical protein